MSKIKLIVIPLLCFVFQNSYAFFSSEDPYNIGNFTFKSCNIIVPDLGSSAALVKAQLLSKGYYPITDNRFYRTSDNLFVMGSGEITANESLNMDTDLQGLSYISVSVAASLAFVQTTLELKVIGEQQGMAPLFESEDRTFIGMGRDTKNVTLYSAKDFPKCEKRKN